MNQKLKTIFALVGFGILIYLSWGALKACKVSSDYAELQGAYAILEAQAKTEKEEAEKKIQETLALDLAKDVRIRELQAEGAGYRKTAEARGVDLRKLKADYTAIEDCPGQVVNLKFQIQNLELTVGDKDAEIALFDEERKTFQAVSKAALEDLDRAWGEKFKAQEGLTKNLEGMNAQLKRDLWNEKFKSHLKTGVLVALAGAWAYDHFREKK